MRIEGLEYNCRVQKSKMCLHIEHWLVYKYPISFTPRECLEEFCDMVGWEFLECRKYTFHCKVPIDKLVMATIYSYADNLHRG